MKDLKPIEKLMMLPSRRKSSDYETAYNNVVTVFRHIDEKEHSNHCKILSCLYNVNIKKFTYLGLANKMHISDNALRRYRTDYTEWFNYYLNLERDGKSNT